MTQYEAHIALPASAVHQAWKRYVGYEGTDGDGYDWRADDGSGLSVTFAENGPEATDLTATGASLPDAVADSAPGSLAELIDGFVNYLSAAFDELEREPGATDGEGLSGPDGTSHTRAVH